MNIRFASMDDAGLLFEWANDPVTRASSFKTEKIKWDEHLSWLSRKLEDVDCYMYIIESEGTPVGTARLEYTPDDGEAVISYTVAPQVRGRGMGTGILKLLETQALEDIGSCTLIGKVKADNIASYSCFCKNGYMRKDDDDPVIVFSKKLTKE